MKLRSVETVGKKPGICQTSGGHAGAGSAESKKTDRNESLFKKMVLS
jgi:hypothetical protein